MPNNIFEIQLTSYRRLIDGALAQVDDNAFREQPTPDSNSIAILVAHLAGNLRSRFTNFLTADGEKAWRDRDTEFEYAALDRTQLMKRFVEAWDIMQAEVTALTSADFERPVIIRGATLTVGAALARASCHVAYHVGQIVMLARGHAGSKWVSLSIPRGQSKEYNRNPTRG